MFRARMGSARVATGLAAGVVALGFAATIVSVSCGTKETRFTEPPAVSTADAAKIDQPDSGEIPPISDGSACDKQKASITGTAFAPNGTLPLYNVAVYIPSKELPAFSKGTSCERCDAKTQAEPIVATLSDSSGRFKLDNVPPGKNVPLVFQVGKWRRRVVLPEVEACKENKLVDPNMTRLPRTQAEGDMPRIAVTTGGADPSLPCILPKIGIDPSEFTATSGPGAVNVYAGNAPSPSIATPQEAFWGDLNQLLRYDIAMLSCEGGEFLNGKPLAARQAMRDFADRGGRIFASHYHYSWFKYGPDPWPKTADWDAGYSGVGSQGPYRVNTSFPKGQALAEWLVTVGASTVLGEVALNEVTLNVGGTVAPTQPWVYIPGLTQYLSFNTPVGQTEDKQCGKAVYAAMHIGGGGGGANYPAGCPAKLTPQEAIFAFLFFDLSSCIQKETEPPILPR